MRFLDRLIGLIVTTLLICGQAAAEQGNLANTANTARSWLEFTKLPDLPDPIGVAGPFVGVQTDPNHPEHEVLLVAGGANFPIAPGEDLWQAKKVWHDDVWLLTRKKTAADGDAPFSYQWSRGGKLDRAVGYGACVSSNRGVVCLGGNNGETIFRRAYLLAWDAPNKQLVQTELPPLPEPCVSGTAAMIGDVVYVAGGQREAGLESAMTNFWRLDLSKLDQASATAWEVLPPWPGPERAFNLTVAQHNGFDNCIYLIGGRLQRPGVEGIDGIEALADVYEFNPQRYDALRTDAAQKQRFQDEEPSGPWRQLTDAPRPIMAGSGAAIGQSHVFVLSGADGSLLRRADELRERHPGFPKHAWAYHTITDTWINAGPIPANQVTTPIASWGDDLIVVSGEVRPRERTSNAWQVRAKRRDRTFGAVDFGVLTCYLLGMVGVGVYFARKNKNTDDYFRGGQQVAWWAAGCSIFATMLSSITYMAIPAKAYAQNNVYLIGNFMILAVAPVAVYLALPFFRRIDATSAYEYLEKRFNRPVRLFASASFSIFHLFRMGIVMSLAGLALATVTPLTPVQCVLIMGLLSIAYCTMGGVEAVIWTDTIQTFVLLGGAVICLGLMCLGTSGGATGLWRIAADHDKLTLFNLHFDATSANVALWVIVLGGIGQNISSYTADQAVVQRYMTTPDIRLAARSIWFAAWLAIPASILFFAMGTGLFAFYSSHPDQLDPTYSTDQILPLFIAQQVPIGVAGLIVAGIFAAAQSTISTSMNSMATAVVTDFLRPFRVCETETGYLRIARISTLSFGVCGTLIGLMFVQPDIRSLFDQFVKVIGLFMGTLGGLFVLGALTTRASGVGALVGVVCGATTMAVLPYFTNVNGYLYAAIGIGACFAMGYLASLLFPPKPHDLAGLTVHTLEQPGTTSSDVTKT